MKNGTQDVRVEAGGQSLSLAKMEEDAMRWALELLKLDTTGAKEVLAVRLLEYYGAQAAADELLYCDGCGAGSVGVDDDEPCPFCGIKDGDEKGATMTTTNGVSEGVTAAAAIVVAKKAATTKAIERAQKKPTEAELNKAVGRVRAVMAEGQACAWKLGVELKAIFDSEMWMTRLGGDGKPAHKTFNDFVREEFQMVRQQAFNYIHAAQNFTREQVAEIGIGKITLVLAAPPGARAALTEGAKDKSKKAIAAEVRAAKQTAPPTTTAAGAVSKRGRKAKVTVITVGDKHNVNLFAAPKKGEEKPVRAKTLADQPWGKHVHENGVAMYFRVRETPSGLQMVIQTKRVEDE